MIKKFFHRLLADKLLVGLTIASLATGMLVAGDFGITWDEPAMRHIGMTNYYHVRGWDNEQYNYEAMWEKDYGVAVELPLVIIEKLFGLESEAAIYGMRHRVTFLYFVLGALCIYLWVKRVFRSRAWATVAWSCWMLHPVLFAHAFYNSKDLPFMCIWALCLLLLSITLEKRSAGMFIATGLALGYLMNIRLMGVLLIAGALALLTVDFIRLKDERMRILKGAALMLGVMGIFLYATWPYLWPDPFGNLAEAFARMSRYPWNNPVLFMGSTVPAPQLPWFFPSVSFAITTPLLFVLSAIAGLVFFGIAVVRRPGALFTTEESRNLLLAAGTGFGGLAAIAILGAVVYDHWRHLFFIWPGILFTAVFGMKKAWDLLSPKRALRILLCTVAGLQFLLLLIFFVRTHPNEQVYFNELVPKADGYIRRNFEYDYWGGSFRTGVEYILANDSRDPVKVLSWSTPIQFSGYMLSERDRRRLVITDKMEEANYFLSNYRDHPMDYPEHGPAWKNFEVGGSEYLSIWKLR